MEPQAGVCALCLVARSKLHMHAKSSIALGSVQCCWCLCIPLCSLEGNLATQWQNMTQQDMDEGIAEGLATCNTMLDGNYAGRCLSVRLTARLYSTRARFHVYARNYLLADDCAYALCLDPFQQEVRPHLSTYVGPLTSAT